MKIALYARVSKEEEGMQKPENQLEPLRKFAQALNGDVVAEYIDRASGGNSNRPQFQQMLRDSDIHKFDLILIWSLDRLSREGISNTLGYLDRFRKNHVSIKSLQESWADTREDSAGYLIISVMAWVARFERERIKQRTKAGLARAKASGKKLGRRYGSKDKKRRRRSGYFRRWSKQSSPA